MKKIRIGNDIAIRWGITQPGGAPYTLAGRDLRVTLSCFNESREVEDFRIEGTNIIAFNFRGREQQHLGPYTLTLEENKGRDGMVTLDHAGAFALVASSAQEGGSGCSRAAASTLELQSAVSLADPVARRMAEEAKEAAGEAYKKAQEAIDETPTPLVLDYNQADPAEKGIGGLTPDKVFEAFASGRRIVLRKGGFLSPLLACTRQTTYDKDAAPLPDGSQPILEDKVAIGYAMQDIDHFPPHNHFTVFQYTASDNAWGILWKN